MGHDHGAITAGGRHRGRLAMVLGIAATILVLEVVGAWLTGSLALLADAGHVFTDMLGVTLALIAATMAQRAPTDRRTFGWQRLEVLAAAFNALLLIGMGLYIGIEAVRRLITPEPVDAGLMLVIALIGLVGNLISLRILTAGKDESINVRGAYLEVLGDLLGSLAVVGAAAVMALTAWDRADAVASLAVAMMILPRALNLLRDAVRILMEATPQDLDLADVRQHLLNVPGVVDVHDLHAWTITSGVPALTAHVVVDDATLEKCGPASMLDQLQHCALDCFEIAHT
ncbi:MAG TPA: cation diffusion facilitator family transporter, partial [Actinomycetota bacterium]|nr:cation diffusion facilitator family transporter [Actinomycetota bacterium]